MQSPTEVYGVWELMSDANLALAKVKEASARYKQMIPSERLIDRGSKECDEASVSNRARACPAAFVCPEDVKPIEYPTVFEMVANDENRSAMDVQWAIMTLIAINEEFRENVAAASPGPAAKLVREMPARFERYLMGTETSCTLTPYEAVCDFTGRVNFVYSGVQQKQ